MTKNKKNFIISAVLWVLFVLFTVLVQVIDVRPIGPQNSAVGFAGINAAVRALGSNPVFYAITEWLGILAAVVAASMAALILWQAFARKSLLKVDRSLIFLLACYLLMGIFYIVFEESIVNYRPILEDGMLEASYPSSHTMMVFFILGTAMIQWKDRIKSRGLRMGANALAVGIIAVTVVGRLFSGVHWFTDIIGGVLMASALVSFYYALHQWSKKEV